LIVDSSLEFVNQLMIYQQQSTPSLPPGFKQYKMLAFGMLARWQFGKFARWQVGKASWQVGKLASWQVGKLA